MNPMEKKHGPYYSPGEWVWIWITISFVAALLFIGFAF